MIYVYTQQGCPFSAIAVERVYRVLAQEQTMTWRVLDISEAKVHGHDVFVTPTAVFPDGHRLTGLQSIRRLQGVLQRPRGVAYMPNKVWYLERTRLFRGIPAAEIEKFAHLFREYDFQPNQTIFAEGDLGDTIYLLKTGHVRIFRMNDDGKEITLALLKPGDVFGELALFETTRRTTYAQTVSSAHICASGVDDFSRLMASRPPLVWMVAQEIAKRKTQDETRIAGLAFGTVGGRLIATLQHLAQEHGSTLPGNSVRIDLRLSHQALANIVGASRESCTIALGKLQRANLIRFDADNYLVIDDLHRLQFGPVDRLIHAVIGKEKESS